MRNALIALAAAVVVYGCVERSHGQGRTAVARPYDGIQAGWDAFQLGEERRRANVAYQLYLNDQLKYWSGIPTSRGETIYYNAGLPGSFAAGHSGNAVPVAPPANLDYTYAYGRQGGRGWGRGMLRERVWLRPQTVFEPWPSVPGDIWGYSYYSPMRQPVGQQQVQTGPNRWESHPVYDPPLPHFQPLPPVDSPLLDGTPYATPRPAAESPAATPTPPPPVPNPPRFDPPATPVPELPPIPPKPRRPREY